METSSLKSTENWKYCNVALICFFWRLKSFNQDGSSQKAYLRRCSCLPPTETQDCIGNKMILVCSHIFGGNMEAWCIRLYLGYQTHTHKENYIINYPQLLALKSSAEHDLENLPRKDLFLKVIIFLLFFF